MATSLAERCVPQEIAPGDEALGDAEVEAIRKRCTEEVARGLRDLVASAPPGLPRRRRLGQELYAGALGQAFGLLHLHERTGEAGQLDLALRYLDAGLAGLAHGSVPLPEDWLSFHASGGASALAAVLYDRLGRPAERDRHLADYGRVADAAAARDFGSEDLLWGRGGFVFGAAWLRACLGEAALPDERVEPALVAMLESGRRHARDHADGLTPGPHGRTPLLYMNLNRFVFECFVRSRLGWRAAPARWLASGVTTVLLRLGERRENLSHRYDIGLVHGLAGALYLLMHFPPILERLGGTGEVRGALDVLLDCVDADHGMLDLLPSRHSPPGVSSDKVHWCNGTSGLVFLFARAYALFGDAAYLEAARVAADHVWRFGLLRKGNGICHGVAGNGYGFLSLYRATGERRDLDRALRFASLTWDPRVTGAQGSPDHPWSLYEGRLGTLCFYQDCLDPAGARFPAFEI